MLPQLGRSPTDSCAPTLFFYPIFKILQRLSPSFEPPPELNAMSRVTNLNPAVANQPVSLGSMDIYSLSSSEKHHHDHSHAAHQCLASSSSCECDSNHPSRKHFYNSRLTRFFLAGLLTFLIVSVVLVIFSLTDVDLFGFGMGGLVKRAADSTTGNNGTFVNNKRRLGRLTSGAVVNFDFIHQYTSSLFSSVCWW
jgi:hypothetical protein